MMYLIWPQVSVNIAKYGYPNLRDHSCHDMCLQNYKIIAHSLYNIEKHIQSYSVSLFLTTGQEVNIVEIQPFE